MLIEQSTRQSRRVQAQADRHSPVSVYASTDEMGLEKGKPQGPLSPRPRKPRGSALSTRRRSSISGATVDYSSNHHAPKEGSTRSQRSSHRRLSLTLCTSTSHHGGNVAKDSSRRGRRALSGGKVASIGAVKSRNSASETQSRVIGGSLRNTRSCFSDDVDPFDPFETDSYEITIETPPPEDLKTSPTIKSSKLPPVRRRASLGDLIKETTSAHRNSSRPCHGASLRYMIEKDASSRPLHSPTDQPSAFTSTGWTVCSSEGKTVSSGEPSLFSSTGWSVSGDSTDSSSVGRAPRRGRRSMHVQK